MEEAACATMSVFPTVWVRRLRRTRFTRRFGQLAGYLSPRALLPVWSLPPQGYARQSWSEDVLRPRPGAALLHLPGTWHRLCVAACGAKLLRAANLPWGFLCALFCAFPFCFLPVDDTALFVYE